MRLHTLAVAAGLLLAAATGAPTAGAHPDCGPWGARARGAPVAFDAGDRAGDYLWHDDGGFHLRVTHRGDGRDVFAGVITSPTPMHLTPVRLEGVDRADVSADGRTLSFVFADHGYIDGIDFTTECADYLTVGPLTVDDGPLPPGRVYLGVARVNPAQVPFTLHRWDV